MTAQIWIDSTRDMLLSGYVEELVLVTTAPTPATTGTTLVVDARSLGPLRRNHGTSPRRPGRAEGTDVRDVD